MNELILELQKAYSLYERSKSPLDWDYFRSVLRKIEIGCDEEELVGWLTGSDYVE